LSIAADGTISAENTDAPGLLDALAGVGRDPRGSSALVLGAGGSARAAVWALREAGATVAVWNRTPERARRLADDLGVRAVERAGAADLLVNCTTIGLAGCSSDADCRFTSLPVAADDLREYACLVDLVYSDRPTALIQAARKRGLETVDGLEILVRQGARSFTTWTGRRAPVAAMRQGASSARQCEKR
jgi:shikimate dehydrogenase